LKQTVQNFLEEKNELLEGRTLLCENNWLFDLAILVDVTDHHNGLNIKLQGMNKLFPKFK